MFELKKKFRFEAGHQLMHHDGKCSHPHGHSYVLTVRCRREDLERSGPKKNMMMDFDDVSHRVRPLLASHLDHKWLNDTLETDSPTAEFIAKWIFDYLKPQLPELYSITIQETETCSATYFA